MIINKFSVLIWLALSPLSVFAQTLDTTALWPNGTELDFGYYEARGVERVDSLLLQNNTEAPFIIENIRSSCGCTAVDWPREPIEPGKRIQIPVAFRCTKGGFVEKHLDVYLSQLVDKMDH